MNEDLKTKEDEDYARLRRADVSRLERCDSDMEKCDVVIKVKENKEKKRAINVRTFYCCFWIFPLSF